MIIDSHCHLKHGDAAGTEYQPEEIVQVMQAAGIDKTVVFAMKTTTRHSLEMAQQAANAHPGSLLPYIYALPSAAEPILPLLEYAIRDLAFKGIKIHGAETSLAAHVIDPVIDLAGQYEVPCLIDFVGRAHDAERLARAFPQTTMIVAHFGKYLCTDMRLIERFIELAAEHDNLILDTSGVVLPWKITEAVPRVGSERIVFGIDGPHPYPTQIAYARAEINKIQSLGLGDVDLENVFWRTISRLLRLECLRCES